MAIYLNTEDAATYLGLKERKLYDLAAQGAVPCSKVTGKWLFPRDALDRWVEAGMSTPPGFTAITAPPILGGSHDPLLEWALRQSGCGLAFLPEGSSAGLERLQSHEVQVAAVHLHGAGVDENLGAIAAKPAFYDCVVIGFARREQGLMLARGNPLDLASLSDAADKKARFGFRQAGAGAQLLLKALVAKHALAMEALFALPTPFPTGADLAFAVRAGEADCGLGSRAMAAQAGLDFLPLIWERFDLVMRRRAYFEPGVQKLMGLMLSPDFHHHAEILGGYDTVDAGQVRLNR